VKPHSCAFCDSAAQNRISPLLWAGSKKFLLETIRPFWHNYKLRYKVDERRIVEPFAGTFAITLGLTPPQALLNDSNYQLMNFHRWIKLNGLPAPIEVSNVETEYYRFRRMFNDCIANQDYADSAIAAYLFYYLNRTCFRGLCRFNAMGQFNVPFGFRKEVHYRSDFKDYQQIYKQWKFKSVDFERLRLQDTDFLYIDPPYHGGKDSFTAYTAGGFSWADQERAAEWAASHKGPVIASNLATPEIVKLYKSLGFKTTKIQAPRRIGGKTAQSTVVEMLAGKNLP
jgi:DNA adenine methylase